MLGQCSWGRSGSAGAHHHPLPGLARLTPPQRPDQCRAEEQNCALHTCFTCRLMSLLFLWDTDLDASSTVFIN